MDTGLDQWLEVWKCATATVRFVLYPSSRAAEED